jgi:hypothetical protein
MLYETTHKYIHPSIYHHHQPLSLRRSFSSVRAYHIHVPSNHGRDGPVVVTRFQKKSQMDSSHSDSSSLSSSSSSSSFSANAPPGLNHTQNEIKAKPPNSTTWYHTHPDTPCTRNPSSCRTTNKKPTLNNPAPPRPIKLHPKGNQCKQQNNAAKSKHTQTSTHTPIFP